MATLKDERTDRLEAVKQLHSHLREIATTTHELGIDQYSGNPCLGGDQYDSIEKAYWLIADAADALEWMIDD